MLKRQFLYVFLNYLLTLCAVLLYWAFKTDFRFNSWDYFLIVLKLYAFIAFLITAAITLFDRLYYNSQTLRQSFVSREGETILSEHKALQVRGFLPVLGKLILTSERLFFSIKGKGFSIWHHEIENAGYISPFEWLFSEKTLQIEIANENEHKESFIIEKWDSFVEHFSKIGNLEKNSIVRVTTQRFLKF